MSSILIIPIRPVDHAELTALIAPVSNTFGLPVSIEESSYLDPSPAFDSYRNQFNSNTILAELENNHGSSKGKLLGITTVDLFVPVLTYVFGEAQLGGRAAVLSAFRLREEFYGLEPNPLLERTRLLKEAIHELGHTFGLVHCRVKECVMHSSTAPEDIDIKGKDFCGECREKLRIK
jgi:archaemetzincin